MCCGDRLRSPPISDIGEAMYRRRRIGGRNVGDIYFGVNTTANCRDLDELAVGPSSATRQKQKRRPSGHRFVA
jgi:hypothetical protein